MKFNKLASLSLILGLTLSTLAGCSSNENILASYKGGDITREEVKKELALGKLLYKAIYQEDLTDEEIKGRAEYVLNSIATSDILTLEGEKQKFTATDEEVEDMLKQIEEIYKNNAEIKSAVEQLGYSDEEIKESVRKEIIATKYAQKIQKDIAISETDAENYYDTYKNSLYTSDYAEASHILIKTVDDDMNKLPEEDIKKAKSKAEEVLKKIKAGEDFAKLAQEYSEDSTASEGGDLGRFYKNDMVEEFDKAVFEVLKEGETSEIVETVYGYHIIKLNKKGVETFQYSDIAATVKNDLFKSLTEEKYVQLESKYSFRVDTDNLKNFVDTLSFEKIDTNKDNKEDSKVDAKQEAKGNSDKTTSASNDTKKEQ